MDAVPLSNDVQDGGYESLAKITSDTTRAGGRPLLVMKFGGTSVADADRIRRVAQRAVAAREAGSDVVVVASAMGKSTDHLIDLANDVSASPNEREMDMLLSTGERISCALI
ncbi:MAG: aspartate kinase, partial [Thermoleophilia bacterium]|nr:aspartate kinase [Thermoleophilia bacterium]